MYGNVRGSSSTLALGSKRLGAWTMRMVVPQTGGKLRKIMNLSFECIEFEREHLNGENI